MVRYRLKSALISAVCLASGLAIYVFMRSDTYFHGFLPQELKAFLSGISNAVPDNILTDFLRFWFVDFLWGASLNFALVSVSAEANKKNFIITSCVSFSVGAVFEIAQKFLLVSGTFDVFDVAMYAAASVLCAVISVKLFLRSRV